MPLLTPGSTNSETFKILSSPYRNYFQNLGCGVPPLARRFRIFDLKRTAFGLRILIFIVSVVTFTNLQGTRNILLLVFGENGGIRKCIIWHTVETKLVGLPDEIA